MSIEIEIVTADHAWPRVKSLFDLAQQPGPASPSPAAIEWAPPELRVIVEADEQPVCHVGLHRREGIWKDRKIRIGGIGGVLTHPDFRRQGLASVAIDAALHTLRDERSNDFALLFCDPDMAGFYTSRNWKPFMGEVFAEQQGERGRFNVMQPLVYYLKRAPHEGELDLCGLPW
jgi:aminoglycoside 2'-N-acetyltransferase I